MVFFCRVILLHFVKGFSLKARILLRFNFSFPYRLPFKFVTTTGALFGSTQLMLFQLCIYEIRAPNTTQVAHLIHGCFLCDGYDLMMLLLLLLLSLLIKLYEAFKWISLTMEHSTTKHLSLFYISGARLRSDQTFPEKSREEIGWHVTIIVTDLKVKKIRTVNNKKWDLAFPTL